MKPPRPWHHFLVQPLAKAADLLFDPSIVFSFDQTGYLRHRCQFDDDDLDVDMSHRICVVTGGNSGLGLATTRALAERGATVWILGRNTVRSEREVAQLKRETQNPHIHQAHLDLTEPDSITQLSQTLPLDRIDILINNAGALLSEKNVTQNGIDQSLATNLTGHLALTAALLERLRRGERARIIWVSSGGMYAKKLNVDHLFSPPAPFDGVAAYAQAKRAMTVISEQLSRQLASQGIAVHCMHPGWAATPGVEQSLPRFWQITRPILRTPAAGADTIVWLAVCDKAAAQPGLFWFDRKPRSLHLLPRTQHTTEEANHLWASVHEWAQLNPIIWDYS